MPTLVILRHAQAAPNKADDHARPLTPKGRADAAAAGRRLQPLLQAPTVVLASDAARTVETAACAFPAADRDLTVRRSASLYNAAASDLLGAIRATPDTVATLVVVGHNPGVSELAKMLAGDGSSADASRLVTGLPTAAAAIFAIDGAWADVAAGDGRVVAVHLPADGPAPA